MAAGALTGTAARRVGHKARRAALTAAKASPLAPLLRRAVHAQRRRRSGDRTPAGR